MKTSTKQFFAALPAVGLVLVAGVVFAAAAVETAAAPVTERPLAVAVQAGSPDGLAPDTTARDWEEVAGSRTRGGFRGR